MARFAASLDAGFVCDIGDKRAVNEDAVLIKKHSYRGAEFGLFAVADGVGGTDRGGEASGTAVNTLASWWDREFIAFLPSGPLAGPTGKGGRFTEEQKKRAAQSLDAAVLRAHGNIRGEGGFDETQPCVDDERAYSGQAAQAPAESRGKTAGTTLSLILIAGGGFFIRHAGDSRVYALGKRGGIVQLTEDHSYGADMLREGLISRGDAAKHPYRAAITRYLGQDGFPGLYKRSDAMRRGDVFLLCSDGFYNAARGEDVIDVIRNKSYAGAQEKAVALRALVGPGRALDNLSLVLVLPVYN